MADVLPTTVETADVIYLLSAHGVEDRLVATYNALSGIGRPDLVKDALRDFRKIMHKAERFAYMSPEEIGDALPALLSFAAGVHGVASAALAAIEWEEET